MHKIYYITILKSSSAVFQKSLNGSKIYTSEIPRSTWLGKINHAKIVKDYSSYYNVSIFAHYIIRDYINE